MSFIQINTSIKFNWLLIRLKNQFMEYICSEKNCSISSILKKKQDLTTPSLLFSFIWLISKNQMRFLNEKRIFVQIREIELSHVAKNGRLITIWYRRYYGRHVTPIHHSIWLLKDQIIVSKSCSTVSIDVDKNVHLHSLFFLFSFRHEATANDSPMSMVIISDIIIQYAQLFCSTMQCLFIRSTNFLRKKSHNSRTSSKLASIFFIETVESFKERDEQIWNNKTTIGWPINVHVNVQFFFLWDIDVPIPGLNLNGCHPNSIRWFWICNKLWSTAFPWKSLNGDMICLWLR